MCHSPTRAVDGARPAGLSGRLGTVCAFLKARLKCGADKLRFALEQGDQVKAGEELCVIDAMKMENVLRAERDGTVEDLKVVPGDSLPVDQVIMTFGGS